MHPLFREFRDLGDDMKITRRGHSKSRAILVYHIVQQTKTPKLRAEK